MAQRFTGDAKDAKKQHIVKLLGEAKTWKEVAATVGVAYRTICDWRVQDETFALDCAQAERDGCDFLVALLRKAILGEVTMTQQQLLASFFLIKQRDPSFRENHKVEHTMTPGLANTLKNFARLGRQ